MLTGRRSFLGILAAGITAGLVAPKPRKFPIPIWVNGNPSTGWTSGASGTASDLPYLHKGDIFTISGVFDADGTLRRYTVQ